MGKPKEPGRAKGDTKRRLEPAPGGRLTHWALRPRPNPGREAELTRGSPPRACVLHLCRCRSLLVGKPQEEEFIRKNPGRVPSRRSKPRHACPRKEPD